MTGCAETAIYVLQLSWQVGSMTKWHLGYSVTWQLCKPFSRWLHAMYLPTVGVVWQVTKLYRYIQWNWVVSLQALWILPWNAWITSVPGLVTRQMPPRPAFQEVPHEVVSSQSEWHERYPVMSAKDVPSPDIRVWEGYLKSVCVFLDTLQKDLWLNGGALFLWWV